jgi:light-regulated signal transduction histidine kinase (bacteriophytochrome)
VNRVQKQLTDTINKSGAIITCNALPTVNGYWQHLNDLFYHLITNAIKFQPQAQVPNIDIQSIDIDDGYQIKIIDNGIGIDPQFHDEVFTMFRQLNHDNDFEGIGAGLAYCRKIMRLHNGSITLSVTEAGQTCFTLTFPK